MTRSTVLGSSILLFALSQAAIAAPGQLAHQGRLLDADDLPLDGSSTLHFALYDAETGGEVVWEETHEVDIVNGYYSLVLGADEESNPLEDETLGSYPLYLELSVDGGDPLEPRHGLVSVPYARMSSTSTSLSGGTVDASEIAVGGQVVVDGDGNWVGLPSPVDWTDLSGVPSGFSDDLDNDALVDFSCLDGDILAWDEVLGEWVCADDQDTTLSESEVDAYVDNNGYALDADLASYVLAGDLDGYTLVADSSCLDGEILAWDSTLEEWVCAEDQDTTLGEAVVDAFVSDNGYALASNLAAIATSGDWEDLDGIPTGLDDGDDDTQLTEAEVDAFADDNGYALVADLAAIATSGDWEDLDGVPAGLDDGDDDTQLTEAEVDAFADDNGYALAADLADYALSAALEAYALVADLAAIATSGDWGDLGGVPSDLADGDDDTQLSEADVDAYADNNGYALESDLADYAAFRGPGRLCADRGPCVHCHQRGLGGPGRGALGPGRWRRRHPAQRVRGGGLRHQ